MSDCPEGRESPRCTLRDDTVFAPLDTSILQGSEMIRRAMKVFSGRWKLEILWMLEHRPHRFNELRRALPQVTQRMLTTQLRELETDGFVHRTVFPEAVLRVEYQLAEDAIQLKPVLDALYAWAHNKLHLEPMPVAADTN